jgi:hypothetical protein
MMIIVLVYTSLHLDHVSFQLRFGLLGDVSGLTVVATKLETDALMSARLWICYINIFEILVIIDGMFSIAYQIFIEKQTTKLLPSLSYDNNDF